MLLTLLHALSPWHWLGLGILLLVLEVFDAGGYMLWVALVAIGLAVLLQIQPELSWKLQLLVFFGLSAPLLLVWRHWCRRLMHH